MTCQHDNPPADDGEAATPAIALPVIAAAPPRPRTSRMSRWRAASLIGVHLLIIAHVLHWAATGRTLSPVEPSEAMYTLNDGQLNAGFLFFAAALAATLLLGRWVCGWGCHLIAYQDLCTWLLGKVGIRPKPLRSRILVLAPLALAIYMFVWPTAYRVWVGAPAPALKNNLIETGFWETFPGPVVAVLTVLVAGFAIVYFLGSKGFCTYACPYGGFFALADKMAVGRIRVTDACEHCGHCTAACTSNVRVHEEVARFSMVVDPGCMKCLDCVSVCPNDALYFGFGLPSLVVKPIAPRRRSLLSFSLTGELAMVVVGVIALLSFRGLYDQIPLLLAMALAGMTAFVVMKLVGLVRDANVRFQQLQLKRGGRLSGAGAIFAAFALGLVALTVHSGTVQYHAWRGRGLARSLALDDAIWQDTVDWWRTAPPDRRAMVDVAIDHLAYADRIGLMTTPSILGELVPLHLARGNTAEAEIVVRRLIEQSPHAAAPRRGLAGILRKTGRMEEAEAVLRQALRADPSFAPARMDLVSLLLTRRRLAEAIALYRDAIALEPEASPWRLSLAGLFLDLGRSDEAALELQALLARHPDLAEAQYQLGYVLLGRRQTLDALPHLSEAVRLSPEVALYRYNLGVATFMAGRPEDARRHIEEAIRLDPEDADAHGFMAVVLRELGDTETAKDAEAKAAALRETR